MLDPRSWPDEHVEPGGRWITLVAVIASAMAAALARIAANRM